MGAGIKGTFVISWSQTEIDGFEAARLVALTVGATWRWTGSALRVDGPIDVLVLDQPLGQAELRQRAARAVRRLVGAAVADERLSDASGDDDAPLRDRSFIVTNGMKTFAVTLIDVPEHPRPLLMFTDDMPPADTDLWVVKRNLSQRPCQDRPLGVICFTPDTRIATAKGHVPVQHLREGDLVQTKDNGLQEVQWLGAKRMTGARLYSSPDLRPIRIRAGAFGIDRPDQEFLVSPDHRLVISGSIARALFNTSEVLVAARDLVNWTTISRDITTPDVTYIHLLLPQHDIVFANGVETESFHPGSTDLGLMSQIDRARLCGVVPDLPSDPMAYGGFARRRLSRSEAALLAHRAA